MEAPREHDDLYEVHDLYFATFCIASGVDMRQCYRRPDGWTIFCFDAAPMQSMLSAWQNMHSVVNVHKYVSAEKYLRGLMRA